MKNPMFYNLRKRLLSISIVAASLFLSKHSLAQCAPDMTAPTINCPSNITVSNDPSSNGASVSYPMPTATDNCPSPGTPVSPGQIIQIGGFASGAFFPVGTTANEYRATDASGNTSTCVFNITVNDNESPVISGCPSNINVNTANALCSQVATWTPPTANDNSTPPTMVSNFNSGDNFLLGATVVNYTATDLAGNSSICSFTVNVVDNENPVFVNCPSNISLAAATGSCSTQAFWMTPGANDNCSISTFTTNFNTGSTFNVGSTTVTYIATDASNNSSTCSFTVTVTDNEMPAITCPLSNITKNTDSGLCSAVTTYSPPVGTDNCSGATTIQTAGLPSGSAFPKGTTANFFKVTDASGNTAICGFNVIVTDNQLPTITCPSNISQNTDLNQCTSVVTYSVNYNDNCPGAVLSQINGLASGASFPKGITVNTYVVTDASGNTINSATCSFSVTISDAQSPIISCPSNITTNATTGVCNKVVTYTPPVGTDNCSGQTTSQIAGSASGATYNVGTTVNTFKVTDASGNSSSCSFSVTVIDAENPTITCSSSISTAAPSGSCTAVVSYSPPVTGDNCSVASTSLTAGLSSGSSFPVGTTVNTFKATDASGNTANCSFSVTVTDIVAPTITCPSNISQGTDAGLCTAAITYSVSHNDNCSGSTLSQISGLASGGNFPKGTTTNSFKVTDASGNTANCSFNVTINDTQSPSISCTSMTVSATTGLCSKVVTYSAPVGTDNCSGQTTTQIAGLASGATFSVGTTTNTYKVTDASGNTNSCSFDVVVTDNENPTITCPSNSSVNAASGVCTQTVTYTTPVGADNCSGQTTTQIAGLSSGSAFTSGVTVNTFKVTDASGNTATCSFSVTVIDTQAPTITCPSSITNTVTPGNCSGIVNYTTPVGVDNCSGSTTIQTSGSSSGSFFTVGTTINTFKVTDVAGNSALCTFNVTMIDNVPPTISNCPSNITLNNATGQCNNTATWVAPTASDVCLMQSFTSTHSSGATFPVGTTVVVYTATDVSSNTALCSFSVTVIDNQNPSITCPSAISVTNTINSCGASVNYTAPSGTDNCAVTTTQTAGLSSGATFTVGTTVNTFKATDASGNTTSCSFNITVTDAQAPTIACPSNISTGATTGSCSAVVSYSPPVTGDNCSVASTIQTAGLSSGATYNVGTTVNTFKVTDAAGNTSVCSFSVTVIDNQNPTITCPSNVTTNAAPSQCSAVVSYSPPVTADNCSVASVIQTSGLASASTFPVGTTTNAFKVTDASGNTANCSFNVTVNDNQAPTITCPSDISKNTDAGLCSAVASFTVNYNDNCSGATLTQLSGLPSGSAFPKGTTVNTFKVTDASGNTSNIATCSFSVIVTDNEQPTITCPPDKTVNNNLNNCSAFVTFASAVGLDNCSGQTTTQISGLSSGSNFPVGTTNNLFQVTDAAGFTAQCLFKVTVLDVTNPVISGCPSNITLNASTGVCTNTATWAVPTATDNCSATTFTTTNNPGDVFSTGVNSVTYIASDASGNTAVCSFSVTIIDNQAPTITCPSNISVSTDAGLCSAVASYSVNHTDNCSGSTVSQLAGLVSGASFPKGITVNTFKATDASGNTSATCSFTVTINDTENPVLTCPSNITVNNTPGQCNANVTYTTSVSDNCPSPTTAQTAGLASGASFPKGITVNTFKATDASGNTSLCTFSVTVNDNEAPVVASCPTSTTVSTDLGQCTKNYSWTTPTVTDNCSGATITQVFGSVSGSAFPKGTNVIAYNAVDASGNSASCSFSITVNDNQNPSISCPSNITASNDPGFCTAVVTYSPLTATDNCSGATVVQTAGLSTGSNFPIGVTVNTFKATDASGNSAVCSFSVSVNETQAPVITCPSNVTANNDLGQCGKVVNYTTPVGTDNCAGVTTAQTAGLASASTFPIGTTVNTFMATDASGNSAACTFSVIIADNELPALTCPSGIAKNTDVGQCNALVTYSVNFSDNCTGSNLVQLAGLPSGSLFPQGTTTNTYKVTDASGNSTSCSFTVNVVDNETPAFTICQTNITLNASPGVCGNVAIFPTPIATDNCTGSLTITQTTGLVSGSTFPIGVNPVSFTALDVHGNSSVCSFSVTIVDDQKPSLACPSSATTVNDPGFCTAQVSYGTITATDNCTNVIITQATGLASGSNFPAGTTMNKFIAIDAAGNKDSCSFNITVIESTVPTITCPSNVSTTNDLGQCGATVTYVTPVGVDNCSGVTTTQMAGLASGASFPKGTTVNTFNVTDASGNSAACSFSVTVADTENPTIVCSPNVNVSNDLGQCGAIVTFTAPVGTDNCTGATTALTAGLVSGTTFPIGTTVNTYNVTDASGNSASCSFSVTVADNENPTITCISDITVSNDLGQCSAVVTFVAPVGTDNCAGSTTALAAGLTSGSTFQIGTTVNTYTVIDAYGNTNTCSFNVIVNDTETPVISCPTDIAASNDIGQCGAVINFTAPVGTDNCTGATTALTAGLTSGVLFPVGITTNVFVVTDNSGNTATCSFVVSVTDTVQPTITCGSDITVNAADFTTCSSVVTYTAPVGLGGCATVNTSLIGGLSSGAAFPVGTTKVTFLAADVFGRNDSCSFNVTVLPVNPVAAFTESTLGADVTFTNNSTESTGYLWVFGDGDSSTVANPVHSYANAGTFNVCLLSFNGCSVDTACTSITILSTDISLNGTSVNVNAYPIPTSDYVNLEIVDTKNRIYSIQVINMIGQSVYTDTFGVTASDKSVKAIKLGDMPVGMYMIQVISEDGQVSRKIPVIKN